MSEPEAFVESAARTWAVVEVFGMQSYGGAIRQVEKLGVNFLEVHVMESFRNREFKVILAAGAIFRMRETNEATARAHVSTIPDEHRIEVNFGGRISHQSACDDDDDDEPELSTCRLCNSPARVEVLEAQFGYCERCNRESTP